MNQELRDFAIRSIGCIYCRKDGYVAIPCEKHHLLTTGLHGNGKRRGESATVGSCQWHHRGIGRGFYANGEPMGPSYAKEARAFRSHYGSDDESLQYQNDLIEQWKRGEIAEVGGA